MVGIPTIMVMAVESHLDFVRVVRVVRGPVVVPSKVCGDAHGQHPRECDRRENDENREPPGQKAPHVESMPDAPEGRQSGRSKAHSMSLWLVISQPAGVRLNRISPWAGAGGSS